jgi:hypothetical protein
MSYFNRWPVVKDDMSAADLPESEGGQDESLCPECDTPDACRAMGRCLLEYEDEDEDEDDS